VPDVHQSEASHEVILPPAPVATADPGKQVDMRIVITGATGNVGTSLVRALAANDQVASIVGIARRLPTWSLPKVEWVQADVAADRLDTHLDGADAVVHLAWLLQPMRRPLVTWRANVTGSQRVFAAAADTGVQAIIYASSIGAYSPARHEKVDESWPTDSMPTPSYGREKAYVERVLDSFEADHPQTRIVRLRPSFIFKRQAATEQRRLFAGPLLPNPLVRPGRLPAVPVPANLRFQAVHGDDVAEAFVRAILSDARGAYNLAAEPVIDADLLAERLGSRAVELPSYLVRAALRAAWVARVVPVQPALLDLFLTLPLLDTTRATAELSWSPRHSALDALDELLDGIASGAGMPTPPLAPDSLRGRLRDVAATITGRG
jgi:UDP-glucose 4-epimerase